MDEIKDVKDWLDPATVFSVAGVLYLLLAGWAAVHVLLNKRSEGAAVSWLGVIVLSPLFGALFYALFGINRMRGRTQDLRSEAAMRQPACLDSPGPCKDDLPDVASSSELMELIRTGSSLHASPMVEGNALQLLCNGDEAYPAMLAAIESAQASVLLSSYIFQNDSVGQAFVAALAHAQQRGVVVRVLIDGVGSRYGLWAMRADRALAKAGVQSARFLSTSSVLSWRFINLRNHRKLLIVDSGLAFVGGMNIREGNVLATAKRHATQDVHFRATGPVVAQLSALFLSDWFFATGENLLLHQAISLPQRADDAHGIVRCRVMVDGPDDDYGKLRLSLMAAINSAKHRVCIVTPYFLPNNALLAIMQLAVLRGVDVHVLLPRKNNLRVVDWAMRANEQRWLRAGIKLSLSDPPFDHSKLFLVDHNWALIGSSNWDDRSLELNFEVNLECVDTAFNQTLYGLFEDKCASSTTLTQRRDSALLPRLRNNFFRLFSPFL